MSRCFEVVLIAAIACTSSQTRPETSAGSQGSLVIRNVTVIPMTGASPWVAQTVIVRDGRIAEMGRTGEVREPAGATVVDGTGKHLIPGLFEMHGHMSKSRASSLGLYVLNGVTTLRDQGSEHSEVVRWRNEIRAGDRVGPRMLIAGPYLESLRNLQRMRADPPESRVEPFERGRIPIGTPADARRVIDSLAALEIDHIKVRTVQDRETYLALGSAARAHGKRLVGHVVTASPATFLEAGQSGVDHGFPMSLDSLPLAERMAFWRWLFIDTLGISPMEALMSATREPAEWLGLADSVGTIASGKVADPAPRCRSSRQHHQQAPHRRGGAARPPAPAERARCAAGGGGGDAGPARE